MNYSVIGIVAGTNEYADLSPNGFEIIKDARDYISTLSPHMKAIVVQSLVVEQAIRINTKLLND